MSTTRPPIVARFQVWLVVAALAAAVVGIVSNVGSQAAVLPYRVDLRVLLLDDDQPWTDALQRSMDTEGIPYTAVPLGAAGRPVITPAFLAAGDRAFYQSVIMPSAAPPQLSADEVAALSAYSAKFGVRQVAGFSFANDAVGLQAPFFVGDIAGTQAQLTPVARADGFGYLNGTVPFGVGSYSYVSEPLPAASMPAGTSYTPLLTATVQGRTGSLVGVHRTAGVERLVITAAFGTSLLQYKYLAHGILSWATRGVHLGYNRNHFTFHVDDGFAPVATWDTENNCTPGSDCPFDADEVAVRMTPDDVAFWSRWTQQNGYEFWIAFNGQYADAANDPLTQSLVANRDAFNWLNHGRGHLFQGCVQDFSVVPWRCTTDANGNIVWIDQAAIQAEIQENIAIGRSLGLPFDATEYLSGEHSGLFLQPRQPVDNPNFVAALTAAGIRFIGSDASRDDVSRQVGSAITVPRHPTVLYYNAATVAQEVDEYNFLYTRRDQGGSGYCEDNPATATCLDAPLDPTTGYTSKIVPDDVAFNLNFIFSNDPRPYYAHTSNLAGDRIAAPWLDSILFTYRSVIAPSAPLLNQTLGQASTSLRRQTAWATNQSTVTAYVQNNNVVIVNPNRVEVPLTVPTGTIVPNVALESYGGEQSAWLPGTVTGAVLPQTRIVVTGTTTISEGVAGGFDLSAVGPSASIASVAGALPAGVAVTVNGTTARVAGTPAAGTAGTYPLTVTAVSGTATVSEVVQLVVARAPVFTSPATLAAAPGTRLAFQVAATGTPLPTISISGSLPFGLSFSGGQNGVATISGTPSNLQSGRTFTVQLTARNAGGSTTQALAITVGRPPTFTSSSTLSTSRNRIVLFSVTTNASPTATVTSSGTLPRGLTVSSTSGGLLIWGIPSRSGTWTVTLTARNSLGTSTQTLTITVR